MANSSKHSHNLTSLERRQVAQFRQLRDKIHASPIYTRNQVTKRNPFEMQTYTLKYKKTTRTVPRLEGPYAQQFFPRELWDVMNAGGPIAPSKKQRHRPPTPRRSQISGSTRQRRIDAAAEEAADEPHENRQEDEEEMMDDEFEDNDSNAGDYAAEGYFEDGEDNAEDDGGGGGDQGEGGREDTY